MAEEKSVVIINKTYSLAKPQEVVQMAVTLKNYIVKQQLFTNIKGKNYAHVDGWQFAGFLVGMTAAVEEEVDLSNDKEIKWKAVAYLYQGEKKTPFRGVAVCSNKESSKKGFDEYAVLSMAQTRAIGKAYRNRMGWMMKLAGYEATPKEEMVGVDHQDAAAPEAPAAKKSSEPIYCHGASRAGCPDGNEISAEESAYSKKVYGKDLCRACQKNSKKK